MVRWRLPNFLGLCAAAVALVLLARGDALAAGPGRHWVPPSELSDLVTADDAAPLESDAVRAAEAPTTTLDPHAPIQVSAATPQPPAADPPAGAPPPQRLRPAVLGTDFPDPSIVWGGDAWYAFATNANGRNVQVSASPDLVHWLAPTDAAPQRPGWAVPSSTWAPTVAKIGDRWVLYVSMGNVFGGQCVDRLTSSSPAGPYLPLPFQPPLVCDETGGTGAIDPTVAIGPDGTPYLYWKAVGAQARQLFGRAMTRDGLAFAGDPVHLLTADAGWQDSGIENPSMVHVGTAPADTWWLLYSGAYWATGSYAMGAARCSSPLGPCTDESRAGPWLASRDGVVGPGGGAIVLGPDGRYRLAYHGWAGGVGYRAGGQRVLYVEPLDLTAAGLAIADAPPVGALEAAQPTPGGLTLTGWAADPDTPAPVTLHVVVNGRTVTSLPATGDRPDVAFAHPFIGAAHGFRIDLGLADGPHHVCVTADDDLQQSTPQLGCADINISSVPYGSLDVAAPAAGARARLAGWAIAPQTPDPIAVQITVDGRTVASTLASVARADLGDTHPAYGPSHGFAVDVPVEAGPHELCAYAVVDDDRPAPQLGCKSVG